MKKLIIANWKMLPQTLAEAEGILEYVNDYLGNLEFSSPTLRSGSRLSNIGIVFCPSFVFIEEVAKILRMSHLEHEAFLGAQDIAIEDAAALTGEVSGTMLRKLGVRYVIVGHSERRWKLGESDEVVNKKLKTALKNELIPIVCIGEKTRLRQDSGGQARDWKDFLRDQTIATFSGLTPDDVAKCIIAYEPVWAISTNPGARPDTPQSALESIHIIEEVLTGKSQIPNPKSQTNSKYQISNLKPIFLYGGSITSKNAHDFLTEKEINGLLIGGASVNKEQFVKILEIASKL